MDYLNRRELRKNNWICRFIGCDRNLYHFNPFFNYSIKYCLQHSDELKRYRKEKDLLKSRLKNRYYRKKNCKYCKTLFNTTLKGKFCSTECGRKWHDEIYQKRKKAKRALARSTKRLYLFCCECGSPITSKYISKQFCSKQCKNKFMKKRVLLRTWGYKV